MGGAGGCGGWTHGDRAPLAGENKLGGGREMFVPVPLSALTYCTGGCCIVALRVNTAQRKFHGGQVHSCLTWIWFCTKTGISCNIMLKFSQLDASSHFWNTDSQSRPAEPSPGPW